MNNLNNVSVQLDSIHNHPGNGDIVTLRVQFEMDMSRLDYIKKIISVIKFTLKNISL